MSHYATGTQCLIVMAICLLVAIPLIILLDSWKWKKETEDETYYEVGEEFSDPYVRIEAQDAEIQRLYYIIEDLKEDIYLLRNIRHSEPQNAGSQSGVASTEGLADSTALKDCE
jgi:hypothetical protein